MNHNQLICEFILRIFFTLCSTMAYNWVKAAENVEFNACVM